eukprot:TRINITY_DN7405_c0_g1_i2.p1 TRINITY_DN7405_c0_g1~~TRINITY_DN7405_c0_g1_i2.p1  ORF type:complete len:368 (-),score=76.77 TRINITY_DN7405_c0_g1_i2:73-1080(-)
MRALRVVGIVFLVAALIFILTAIIWPVKFSKRENSLGPQWSNESPVMAVPPTIPPPSFVSLSLPLILNNGEWKTFRYDVPKGTNTNNPSNERKMRALRVVGIVFLVAALIFILTAIIWPVKFSKRENSLGPQWSNESPVMAVPPTIPPPSFVSLSFSSLPLILNNGEWKTFRYDVPKGSNGTVLMFEVNADEMRPNRDFYFTPSYANSNPKFAKDTVKFYHPKNQSFEANDVPIVYVVQRNWTVCEGSNFFSFYYNSTNATDTTWAVSGDYFKQDASFSALTCLNYFIPSDVEDVLTKVGAVGLGLLFGIPGFVCLVGGLICFACGKKSHHYNRL